MATQVTLGSGVIDSASGLKLRSNGSTEAVDISTGQVVTLAQNPILTSGTANGVAYLNGSKVVTSGSALTFDGVTLKSAQGSSGTTAVSNGNALVLENGSAVGMSLLTPDANASRIYFGTASNNRNAFIYSDYNSGAQTLIFGLGSGVTAATEQMRLTSTGLGIGTSSPAARLDAQQSTTDMVGVSILNTNNNVSTTTSAQLRIGITNSAGASYAVIKAQEASADDYPALTFGVQNAVTTTPTERMRIDSSGNLLIATTSAVTNGGFKFTPDNGTTGSSVLSVGHKSGTASGDYYHIFYYGASPIGSITQNGTTAVAYNTTSDYRLKNNIEPLTGALAKVQALKPSKFVWVDGREDDGFIAHELQEVLPNVVIGEKDAVDGEGNPKYQQVDYSRVVATLTAAIQEQQSIIEQLTTRIAALESKGA